MKTKRKYRILISGGGTGGHIFPAVAIANALKRRDADSEILFVGAENRMEMERVPAAGYKIIGLPVCGFDRKRLWRNFKVLWKLFKSMRLARKILCDFKPDMAVGVGGYASGPMLKAAQKNGIPTLLQEQNSYAGVTNKLLAQKASAICVAYDNMGRFFPEKSIVKTGNPVRQAVLEVSQTQAEAKELLGFDSKRPLVLVVGGSLGARTINESIGASLEKLTAAGASVMWQTGKLYAEECSAKAKDVPHVKAMPFITDMGLAYRAADVVVSRAGASTISELQLLGKPSILVPSPNVAEDHQRKNAQALADVGASVMVLDADAQAHLADEVVAMLADESRRQLIAENVLKMALPQADEKIVDTIYSILSKESK